MLVLLVAAGVVLGLLVFAAARTETFWNVLGSLAFVAILVWIFH